MIIRSLSLSDIRNYSELSLDFEPGINILYGDNAQGKTNVLEAIGLIATTRSHRGSKDREIIRFGCSEGHIRSIIERDSATYRVDMHLREGRAKGIAIDGVRLKRAAQLVGQLFVVSFTPEDLGVVKSGPSERRRFMDMELCQLDSVYLTDLTRYNRLIAERNRVLKGLWEHPENEMLLDIQDAQLVQLGQAVIARRKAFLEEIEETVAAVHRKLTGGKEDLKVIYSPDTDGERLEESLKKNRQRDIAMKQTTCGPHKDDFVFRITGDIDLRKYGSQGQQRTAALSLKLSEIELIKRIKGENPVLLLDDVLSELDSSRQKDLLDSMGGIQTIITCTGLDEFIDGRLRIDRVFRVTDGHVAPAEETI